MEARAHTPLASRSESPESPRREEHVGRRRKGQESQSLTARLASDGCALSRMRLLQPTSRLWGGEGRVPSD
eukprot:342527-Prymnesium_polylepis.2